MNSKLKQSYFKWFACSVVALLLIFALTQCTPKHVEQRPLVKVNIVTWPGYGPIYLAKEKGFFQQEGIDVDCQIQENTQARHAALVAGQIDLVGITLESVVLADAQGVPMQVVGVSDISNGGDGIVANAKIKTIADLKGKRVAFPEGQPSHLFLLYHLDKVGLGPGDIKPVLTDDAGKAGEIFAAGQTDGAVTWEPWLSRVVEAGKGHVLVNSKGAKDILIGILAANRNKLDEKNIDKLQRFYRGWYRALDYYRAHPDESIPIMAKGFQLPPEEFSGILSGLRFIDKSEAKHLVGADGSVGGFYNIAKYEEKLWEKAGAIKQPVDPSLAYTSKVLAGVQ